MKKREGLSKIKCLIKWGWKMDLHWQMWKKLGELQNELGKKKKQTKKHGKHHTSLLDICPSCSKGEEEEVLKKIGRSRKK